MRRAREGDGRPQKKWRARISRAGMRARGLSHGWRRRRKIVVRARARDEGATKAIFCVRVLLRVVVGRSTRGERVGDSQIRV